MKTIAIIQARLGATRLPGKMLMDIAGQPAISWVVERVRLSQLVHQVWLATTNNPTDDPLAAWAEKAQVPLFRGSEHDVLDRYYQAAKAAGADVVVRVTGDCPLADYRVIDRVVSAYGKGEHFDYVSNVHPPTFPDGLDTEVFSFGALERASKEALLPSEREHVTPYIWKNARLFRLHNVTNQTDVSAERWTLDTTEDLQFLRRVCEEIRRQKDFCGFERILEIVLSHPDWRLINAHLERNAGYQKSLLADTQK